jgi:cardiolipin synthase
MTMGELVLLPNIITLIRLLLAVPVAWILYQSENTSIPFILTALAGFTDILDGLLARKLKMTSKTGTILDPLADKILVVGILIALSAKGELNWLWLAVLVVKELGLLLGGLILLMQGKTVPSARIWGKMATAFILSGILCILLPPFNLVTLGLVLVKAGIAVSILAGVDYLVLILKPNGQ